MNGYTDQNERKRGVQKLIFEHQSTIQYREYIKRKKTWVLRNVKKMLQVCNISPIGEMLSGKMRECRGQNRDRMPVPFENPLSGFENPLNWCGHPRMNGPKRKWGWNISAICTTMEKAVCA